MLKFFQTESNLSAKGIYWMLNDKRKKNVLMFVIEERAS
jgi:hypothetical protein